jgi:DNA-binding HxlR family transcriptional regulator
VGPIEIPRTLGKARFAVVLVESERAAGPLTFEELRDQIRGRLADQNAINRYLRDLRRRTYVSIRL